MSPTDDAHGEALLAAVYAAPADVAARTVYADWLTARGDPRGELITLQLAATTRVKVDRRVASLIHANWKKWLEPISKFLVPRPRFERGFPVFAQLAPRSKAKEVRATFDAPVWSTFETIRLPQGSPIAAEEFCTAVFRALVAVEGIAPEGIQSLASRAPRWTRLDFAATVDDEFVAPAGALGQFPALREVSLVAADLSALAPAFDELRPLSVLHLDVSTMPLARAHWALIERWPVDEVRLHRVGGAAVRVRRVNGRFTHATVGATRMLDLFVASLPEGLTVLDTDAKTKLSVTPEALANLKAALQRFSALQTCELPWFVEKRTSFPLQRLGLRGRPFLVPELIPPLWAVFVDHFGVRFDRISDTAAAPEAHEDVYGELKRVAEGRRRRVTLALSGTDVTATLTRDDDSFTELVLPMLNSETFFAGFEALLDLVDIDLVSLSDSLGATTLSAPWDELKAANALAWFRGKRPPRGGGNRPDDE